MKIVSFNVNGLRSRLHQVEAVIGKYHPDIIGLQETKVQDAEFPAAFLFRAPACRSGARPPRSAA